MPRMATDTSRKLSVGRCCVEVAVDPVSSKNFSFGARETTHTAAVGKSLFPVVTWRFPERSLEVVRSADLAARPDKRGCA